MAEEPNKTEDKREFNRREDGTFGENNNANPKGRPKGKTLKEWLKDRLAVMTDEEREEWLKVISKDLQWRMAEGNPHQTGDITSAGKPIPILNLNEIHKNNGNDQDTETDQKD